MPPRAKSNCWTPGVFLGDFRGFRSPKTATKSEVVCLNQRLPDLSAQGSPIFFLIPYVFRQGRGGQPLRFFRHIQGGWAESGLFFLLRKSAIFQLLFIRETKVWYALAPFPGYTIELEWLLCMRVFRRYAIFFKCVKKNSVTFLHRGFRGVRDGLES